MKTFTALCLLGLLALVAADDKYTNRFDTIDVDQIIKNRRLLLPYILCVLDKGKCTAEGKELKSHIQEAVEKYCDKCTEAQRAGTRRVIAHLINNESDLWNQLTEKYDPERKYVTKYEAELKTVKA